MRRVVSSTLTPVAAVAASAVVTASSPSAVPRRNFWDPYGHQAESAFLDRKDFDQMYPAQKPKVSAGEYGYQKAGAWGVMLVPNPSLRLPHERRRLNPKPAKVVTVFGGSGYLATHILEELLQHPKIEKVRATTRYPTLIPEGSDLDKLLQQYPEKLELHECDVTDRIQVNVAANGADTLIFAVDFHNEYANNSHFDVFVTGAQNVAWTARSVRAERVIYCNGLDATFASESNYVDMRARGEDATAANQPDATILRFGPLYGGNYRYKGLGRFIYPCCFADTNVQPTWVRDAARLAVRSCFSSRAVRRKIDLGGPQTMTHLQWATNMSALFQSRLVFPLATSVGRFFSRVAPWVCPNPWFDDNYLLTFELDQLNRRSALFDRLASWELMGYRPHTMQEASLIERGEADPLEPLHELDEKFFELETEDKRAFTEEEEAAKRAGILRAKAEPGFGRTDGLEALAQEIYPGSQFRYKPLEGAKYPDTVKNPGPISIH